MSAALGEATVPRLAPIKVRHDPDNVFRVDQNIEPAPTTTAPMVDGDERTPATDDHRDRQRRTPGRSGQETPCPPTQR
jgi:hypothetical protein